ncbi:hypothetical protein ACH5RR_014528 [Cinchona calisaya]|uniref:DUF7950 domain-containing protein n=1 Tax=Cinchona calisaya TaxID=153742 RepID=A0ABD3A349_9GENT
MPRVRSSGRKKGSCSLSDNYSTVNQMMMVRFRPIAPKPIDGQAVPCTEILQEKTNGKSAKRKYARIRRNKQYSNTKRKRRSNRISPVVESPTLTTEKSLVTLQLLPKGKSNEEEGLKNDEEVWINAEEDTNEYQTYNDDFADSDEKVVMQRPSTIIESWVIVERVMTNTMCMKEDGIGLIGFSDEDKINNLKIDSCPGFVSDSAGKVQWVNEAYKTFVCRQEDKEHQDYQPITELAVQVVAKEDQLPYSYPLFSCTVRFEYALGGRKSSRIVVPCDVWRMEFGGFAWKLDIKASLSLGLQPY